MGQTHLVRWERGPRNLMLPVLNSQHTDQPTQAVVLPDPRSPRLTADDPRTALRSNNFTAPTGGGAWRGAPPRLSPAREEGTAARRVRPRLWRLHGAGMGPQKLLGLSHRQGPRPGMPGQAAVTIWPAVLAASPAPTPCDSSWRGDPTFQNHWAPQTRPLWPPLPTTGCPEICLPRAGQAQSLLHGEGPSDL